jgi:hypothetical protein
MDERLPEEIEWYLSRFITLIQACQDERFRASWYSTRVVTAEKGRVYWKIWIDDLDPGSMQRRIFGFVRIKDGAIFMAADFRKPATKGKNAIRGYIWEEHPENHFTWTGIVYDQFFRFCENRWDNP